MKYGLSDNDWSVILLEIKKYLGKTTNPKLYVYGSRAKGTHKKFSDVDLLLSADHFDRESLSKLDFTELSIPYKVDFVLDLDLFEAYREEINSHKKELILL